MPVLAGQILALIGLPSSSISFFAVLDKGNFATGHDFRKVVLVGEEKPGWEAQIAAWEAKYPPGTDAPLPHQSAWLCFPCLPYTRKQ